MRDDGRPIDLTRRKLTLAAVLAVLSGVTITITGCGGGGSDSPSGPSGGGGGGGTADGVNGTISANHGHTAFISNAQLTGTSSVSLDISGSAGHSHAVSLTAAQLANINGGQSVSVESSPGDGHTHIVTFRR
jgi:hypothetical protein